jgi:hypothetical protein
VGPGPGCAERCRWDWVFWPHRARQENARRCNYRLGTPGNLSWVGCGCSNERRTPTWDRPGMRKGRPPGSSLVSFKRISRRDLGVAVSGPAGGQAYFAFAVDNKSSQQLCKSKAFGRILPIAMRRMSASHPDTVTTISRWEELADVTAVPLLTHHPLTHACWIPTFVCGLFSDTAAYRGIPIYTERLQAQADSG